MWTSYAGFEAIVFLKRNCVILLVVLLSSLSLGFVSFSGLECIAYTMSFFDLGCIGLMESLFRKGFDGAVFEYIGAVLNQDM